jgi:hypothetical protein
MSVSPEEVAAAKTTVSPHLANGSVLAHMAEAMNERHGDVRQVPNENALALREAWTRARDAARLEGDRPERVATYAMRLDTYARLFVDEPEDKQTGAENAESLLAQLNEAREKIAYLRAGALHATREELVAKITTVGAAEWQSGAWLSERLADARQQGAAYERDRAERG